MNRFTTGLIFTDGSRAENITQSCKKNATFPGSLISINPLPESRAAGAPLQFTFDCFQMSTQTISLFRLNRQTHELIVP
ncbi:hypothetical protein [Burkholderia alba]|uniref:hypothetical protein n=1 Tax=Burkholderia alba TaxID=2683677 RepID=UPI002B05FAF8|nr:hypothetical protein [Burkholderia alba]